jgi:hypothetical protein
VADNNEPTLRNALDAVNTGRKWALLGIAGMGFSVVLLLFMLFMMVIPSIQPPGDVAQPGVTVDAPAATPTVAINRLIPLKVLWVSSAIQLLFVACATGAVMLHVSKMTRAVLRAIEATARKS